MRLGIRLPYDFVVRPVSTESIVQSCLIADSLPVTDRVARESALW